MTTQLNNWNEAEVKRAERLWGHKTPQYTIDMFNFAIADSKSWLDLGCGFGRFLEYLLDHKEEPDYIGYDSSESMISRISERFPTYAPRVFHRPITTLFNHTPNSILCSAVLIHITLQEQQAVLKNLSTSKAKRITFDINSPSENYLTRSNLLTRHIKGSEGAFRMTWQSHYVMTKKVINLFPDYSITLSFYKLQSARHKVVYFLEKL
jgi:trans-aconitate methyltransferase